MVDIKSVNENKGSTTLTVLLIVMLLIIGILIYFLAGGKIPENNKPAIAVDSPNQTFDTDIPQRSSTFNDGLRNPNFSEQYELNEFGEGVASKEIFDIDINGDGHKDRITKTKNENGTPHFYYEYKIELNNKGTFVDITPNGFRTTEGVECALQKLQFIFNPEFRVIKISRNWEETWENPTIATKTVYAFSDGNLKEISKTETKSVCDVSELF